MLCRRKETKTSLGHNLLYRAWNERNLVYIVYTFLNSVKHRCFFFITQVYLQSVQNTMSKWEETETNVEEESSVALIHMEEAQGVEW
jgi:hypothetical protein